MLRSMVGLSLSLSVLLLSAAEPSPQLHALVQWIVFLVLSLFLVCTAPPFVRRFE